MGNEWLETALSGPLVGYTLGGNLLEAQSPLADAPIFLVLGEEYLSLVG